MLEQLQTYADLTPAEIATVGVVVFLAAIVRGFSGFALSALVMASLAVMIPPVELIALCWFLEMAASVLMVRGGAGEADKKVVFGLVSGSIVGTPIGLTLTTTVPVSTSKMIALAVICVLAILLLSKMRWRFLATRPGLYLSGLTAGIMTGLASVGGLVVTLYVLSQDMPARVIRASLVIFLFVSSSASFFYLIFYGLMTNTILARAVFTVPLVFAGVFIGKTIFRPSMERHYKRFCLMLLIALAGFGLLQTITSG